MRTNKPYSLANNKKKKQLNPVSQKQTKTPFLLEHQTRLQQKLSKLKSQIGQKKKNATQTNMKGTTQTSIKSVRKEKSNIQVDSQLNNFLIRMGMSEYTEKLAQNGIDSLDILSQIKQKQLQQIGIAKGHALKICVNIKKLFQKEKKEEQIKRTEQTQMQKSKLSQKPQKKQNMKVEPLQIIIQTQIQSQVLPKKKYFCLYCYKRADNEFCDEDCSHHYNKMFQKYQNNLRKAQEMFVKVQQQKQESEQNDGQVVDNFDFLQIGGDEERQQFDEQVYEFAIRQIKQQ